MNILYVTANRLGDAVLSSGLLAHLIAHHPSARITVACGAVAAPLFEATPNVTRIFTLVKRPWAGHWLGLWRRTVATKWDIVVDLRGSALAWLLPAQQRFVLRKDDGPVHRAEMYSRLLGLVETAEPCLNLGEKHFARATELVPSSRTVLAVGPTANWGGKRWPAASFVALIERLTGIGGAFHGAHVAVLGAAEERSSAEAVLAAVPGERQIDLVGTEDLLTLAACLQRCSFYVGNDSGLMHVAAATGIPTLGLFGPSREVHYAPRGKNAACVRTPESYDDIVGAPGYDYRDQNSLMATLSIEAVERAVHELITSARQKAS
tara:strand:+ start:1102 stop:2064 length:963 start_codon:yes stop_codon:yes gene_type:complete